MSAQPVTTDEGVPLTSGSVLSVPGSMLYHAVEDGELERLMKIQRPFFGVVALTAIGGFFGVLAGAVGALNKVMQQPAVASDIAYLTIATTLITVAICTGIIAFTGKSDAVKALEDIRSRPKIPLPPGHPAAPPTI